MWGFGTPSWLWFELLFTDVRLIDVFRFSDQGFSILFNVLSLIICLRFTFTSVSFYVYFDEYSLTRLGIYTSHQLVIVLWFFEYVS